VNELQTKDITILSKYDQKQIITQIQQLKKLLQIKWQEMKITKFEFVGPPLPPQNERQSNQNEDKKGSNNSFSSCTTTNTSKTTTTTPISCIPLNNIVCNIINQHIFQVSEQILIENVTNSIIDVASNSINFNHGNKNLVKFTSLGSVFIHNLSNSILIVKCHQLRLHNVTNCGIFHQVNSKSIIIENCHTLTLASIIEDDDKKENNEYDYHIDDFNFPTKTLTNPNYKIITLELSGIYEKCLQLIENPPDHIDQQLLDQIQIP
jgi:uncharacterized protein YejL (UPF0352 family)